MIFQKEMDGLGFGARLRGWMKAVDSSRQQ